MENKQSICASILLIIVLSSQANAALLVETDSDVVAVVQISYYDETDITDLFGRSATALPDVAEIVTESAEDTPNYDWGIIISSTDKIESASFENTSYHNSQSSAVTLYDTMPAPATMALLALGGLPLLFRRNM